jgi:hypothetical protein
MTEHNAMIATLVTADVSDGAYRAYSPKLDCEGLVQVRSSTIGAQIVRGSAVELLDGRIAI